MAHDKFEVPYDKIASVADLVSAAEGRRQIVKFHGDFDDESSIVLDETSYFQRLNYESPLDIKLSNDVLGNSVLFIGYSISDINIRLLFYRLTEMWGALRITIRQTKVICIHESAEPCCSGSAGAMGNRDDRFGRG